MPARKWPKMITFRHKIFANFSYWKQWCIIAHTDPKLTHLGPNLAQNWVCGLYIDIDSYDNVWFFSTIPGYHYIFNDPLIQEVVLRLFFFILGSWDYFPWAWDIPLTFKRTSQAVFCESGPLEIISEFCYFHINSKYIGIFDNKSQYKMCCVFADFYARRKL